MDKNVQNSTQLDQAKSFVSEPSQLSSEERQWLAQFRGECEELEFEGVREHLFKQVKESIAPEPALKRLKLLQQELDRKDLVALLNEMMARFDLSKDRLAVSAKIDPSVLGKILGGEHRLFKPENVDALLEDLCWGDGRPGKGILWDFMEFAAWYEALKVATADKEGMDKVFEKRLEKINDITLRKKVKEELRQSLDVELKRHFWETGWQFPALVPFAETAAGDMLKKWDWVKVPNGFQLHNLAADRYDLISTDLFPKKITGLGPGLRIKDTGFGTYTVYRETPRPAPIQQETAKADDGVSQQKKEPGETATESERQPERRTATFIEPELIHIPAGNFWMGSHDQDKEAFENEKPRHRVYLADYWIGRAPITNEEYRYFLLATPDHRKPFNWQGFNFPSGKARHPVREVTWEDAVAYCRWLSQITGKTFRLPSEAEWEKAARGTDGWLYPWGNQAPDASYCNFNNNMKDTTPVGQYSPKGDSPYGCVDMVGNVWEWTRSQYQPYPYDPADGREDLASGDRRVLRGGSWYNYRYGARCACRDWSVPGDFDSSLGFRFVRSPILF